MTRNYYWYGNGKYQTEYDQLVKLVPLSGAADTLPVELVRNIGNLIYDHYNNGNMNWDNKADQFAHIESVAWVLHKSAAEEGVADLTTLLKEIKSALDAAWVENDDYEIRYDFRRVVNDWCDLDDKWEKVADIVIRWASQNI